MSHPTVPICRICLSNDELQVSLYSSYAQRRLLLTKIRVCLPIKISHTDTLPVTICSQCIVRLEQFYEYYCKSETSQRILAEGTNSLSVLQRRKKHPESLPVSTPFTNDEPSQGITSVCVSDDVRKVADDLDPILTQSPKVKNTSIASEITAHDAISANQSLSFLNDGQKVGSKRKSKMPAKLNQFITF